MDDKIEIPLSKKKLILVLLGALMFFVLGVFFVFNSSNISESIQEDKTLITILGGISILLFGTVGIILIKKLFDKRPGLIIDDQGITITDGAMAIIYWKDIKDFSDLTINRNKLLCIELHNTKEYINKISNRLKKITAKSNYKYYGTPLCISAISLQISFDELKSLLIEERTKNSKL